MDHMHKFWTYMGHLIATRLTLALTVALWRHMATEIWVHIGSGNGLLPDGTKPLPEIWLIFCEIRVWNPMTFTWKQFHRGILKISIFDIYLKMTNLKLQPHLPGANELI